MSYLKKTFSNLKSKISKLDKIGKIAVVLWVICLLLLFVFVGLALLFQEDKTVINANVLTTFGLIFIIDLFAALLSTVIPQITKRSKKINKGGR